MSNNEEKEYVNVFSKKFMGGPLNLGEPEDRTLRHLEEQIFITQMVKDRAHHEKCKDFVQNWGECMEENAYGWKGYLTFITCQKPLKEMNNCLKHYYGDPELRKHCENIYLDKRSKYRETGVIEKDPYFKKAYYESKKKREFIESIRKSREQKTADN